MITAFTLFVVLPIIFVVYAKKEKKEEQKFTPVLSLPQALKSDIKNGVLPNIRCDNLFLLQNEICHFVENARYDTFSTEKYYVRYGSSSSSKNNKGYRSSLYSYHPYTTQRRIRHIGKIYITNQQIVFSSSNYGITIPLSDIITANPSENYISFHCTHNIYKFYVPDGFLILELLNNINKNTNYIWR